LIIIIKVDHQKLFSAQPNTTPQTNFATCYTSLSPQ
jgi:hypothetical protein